jgi:hypothetical protein
MTPLSLKSSKYSDPGLNKFKKTNLHFATNPYLLYQDPTWLGFKLLFFFNQPDGRLLCYNEDVPNTAYSYLNSIGDIARAKYLKKFVSHLENINKTTPWFFQSIDGLSEAWKRGFHEDDFKALLPADRKISIDCLESIDLRMSALMDLYRKACFDWKYRREVVPSNLRKFTVYIYVYEIRTINREGKPSPSGLLDLSKMAGIPDINAEQQKQNETLLGKDPFGNDSKKSPISQIKDKAQAFAKDPIKGIKDAVSPSDGNESANTINPYINRFLFKFGNCEWLPDESNVHLTKISSAGEDAPTVQKLVFNYKEVEEVNLYNIYSNDQFVQDSIINLLDGAAMDNSALSGSQSKGTDNTSIFGQLQSGDDPTKLSYGLSSVLNPKYNAILPFASLAADKIERLISSAVGKLLMGNIYGFSATTAGGLAAGALTGDPTSIVAAGAAILNSGPSKSLRNATDDRVTLGNIYG